MMTSCVVADDPADLRERLAAFKAVTGREEPAISGTVDEVAEPTARSTKRRASSG